MGLKGVEFDEDGYYSECLMCGRNVYGPTLEDVPLYCPDCASKKVRE